MSESKTYLKGLAAGIEDFVTFYGYHKYLTGNFTIAEAVERWQEIDDPSKKRIKERVLEKINRIGKKSE